MNLHFFRGRTASGNARVLNMFGFWFCLRFYSAVAVVYFARVTGSYVLGVSILVIAQVVQGLLEVPTGIVSDRVGRVWCLRIGAVASLVSVVCYVGGSYWWLVTGAVLEGAWRALFSGNNEALLYESARESGDVEGFGRHLGRLNVAMEGAGFAAVAVGGFVAAWSFEGALWLTAVAQVPAIVAGFWLVEPKKHVVVATNVWTHFREALGYMRRNVTLRNLSVAKIMSDGFSTYALWPAFYTGLMPIWAVGAVYSVNPLLSALGFGASGWFMKRWAPIRIMLANEFWGRALMLTALVWPSKVSPALMALGGAAYGPATVATGTLMHREFTDHQRATMASITSLLSNVVYAVFALGVGLVADRWGAGKAIMVGQILLLPIIWLYWRVRRRTVRL